MTGAGLLARFAKSVETAIKMWLWPLYLDFDKNASIRAGMLLLNAAWSRIYLSLQGQLQLKLLLMSTAEL